MDAALYGHLDAVKWIVSQLGSDCLSVTDLNGDTAILRVRNCGGQQAMVEYIFDVLGGEALRVAASGETQLQLLENRQGTDDAQPETLALLRCLAIDPGRAAGAALLSRTAGARQGDAWCRQLSRCCDARRTAEDRLRERVAE